MRVEVQPSLIDDLLRVTAVATADGIDPIAVTVAVRGVVGSQEAAVEALASMVAGEFAKALHPVLVERLREVI